MHIPQSTAIKIAQSLEKTILRLGAHCALGGSCLHQGGSYKDVDIYIYAHDGDDAPTEKELIKAIKKRGLSMVQDFREMSDNSNYSITKRMVRFDWSGVTVEVFFFL